MFLRKAMLIIQENNTICLNCYNGIMINRSHEFQQHAAEQYAQTNERQRETDESSRSTNSILSKVSYMSAKIKKKKPTLYSLEFWAKDARLKSFFLMNYIFLHVKNITINVLLMIILLRILNKIDNFFMEFGISLLIMQKGIWQCI